MDADVIVVGAGPAGLMLAGELRLAGVPAIVIDRLAEPTGESRGLGFTARTMEVFDQRGLLPRFGEISTGPRGHFGGLPVDFGVLDGAHFAAHGIPQARTEAILAAWAGELGADLRRGWDLVGLDIEEHCVTAQVRGPAGPRELRARYLVGCDGGRSTVRRAAGFDFPGTAATLEMFLADVAGCAIAPRPIGRTVPRGFFMAGPVAAGVDRIIICERGAPPRQRTEPPPWAEVAAAWQRLTGEDISAGTPIWTSAFGDATRQVTEYRRGRVLLAGDAAHIHLPAGGQGLNVSVQDAANLGWKLVAQVRGWAPPGLLDSYHTERHPVGQRLLLNTRAQGLILLGGEAMQPLRDVLTELIVFENVSRHLAGMVSGLDICYDVGPGAGDVRSEERSDEDGRNRRIPGARASGAGAEQHGPGEHPLLGRRMPHQDLVGEAGKTSSTRLLHPARGVLLDFADDARLRRTAAGWADRVDVVTAAPHGVEATSQLAGTAALLLRPDGHVAWAAPGGGELAASLRRWFGAAGPATEGPR